MELFSPDVDAAAQEARRPVAPTGRVSYQPPQPPPPVYLDPFQLPPSGTPAAVIAEPAQTVIAEPALAGAEPALVGCLAPEAGSHAKESAAEDWGQEQMSDEAVMEHAKRVAERVAALQQIPAWRSVRWMEDPDLRVLPFRGISALAEFFLDTARVQKLTFVVLCGYKKGHECTIDWLLNATVSPDMQRQASWTTAR